VFAATTRIAVEPLVIKSARSQTLPRHPSADIVRSKQSLQHAAVACCFLWRDLKRYRLQSAAGSCPQRKCACTLVQDTQAAAL
jgi:hypothetical protein